MRLYMKAYYLRDLRRFTGWKDPAETLPDDAIVYLADDLVVMRDVFEDSPVLYSSADPAWQQFCRDDLKFSPPQD